MARGVGRMNHFICIGGQKCGSTTFHADISQNPHVLIPDKETSHLETAATPSAYARAVRTARAPCTGEVSTRYSFAENAGIAQKARALSPSARIIYIMRNPIERLISHHNHNFGLGVSHPDLRAALAQDSSLIANSLYDQRLEPWVTAFGRERVLLIRFESYVTDRQGTIDQVADWLGLQRSKLRSEAALNTKNDKFVATGAWAHLSQNQLYRQTLRRVLPADMRRKVLKLILPEPAAPLPPPSPDVLSAFVPQFETMQDNLWRRYGFLGAWDIAGAAAP